MELMLPAVLGAVESSLGREACVFRQHPWHCARLPCQLAQRVKSRTLPVADTHLRVIVRMGRGTRSPWQMLVSQKYASFLSDTKIWFC